MAGNLSKLNYFVIFQFTMSDDQKINLPRALWKEILGFLDNDRYVPQLESRIERQAKHLHRAAGLAEENVELGREIERLENILVHRNEYIANLEQEHDHDFWKIQQLQTSIWHLENQIRFYERNPVRRRLTYNQ